MTATTKPTASAIICGLMTMILLSACHNASPTPPAADAHGYTTKSFRVPFTATVPADMPATPATDEHNFVTWGQFKTSSETEPAIRFMLPVSVFPPGSTAPTPPPANYLQYLRKLSAAGARFADETSLNVDGHPATILTATAAAGVVLDGAVGCPTTETDPKSCFALESTLVLRLSVIPLDGGLTLVAWVRTGPTATDQVSQFKHFEQMLTSIRFASRSPDASVAPVSLTDSGPIVFTRYDQTTGQPQIFITNADRQRERQLLLPVVADSRPGHQTARSSSSPSDPTRHPGRRR